MQRFAPFKKKKFETFFFSINFFFFFWGGGGGGGGGGGEGCAHARLFDDWTLEQFQAPNPRQNSLTQQFCPLHLYFNEFITIFGPFARYPTSLS